jgi:hypothetical protein
VRESLEKPAHDAIGESDINQGKIDTWVFGIRRRRSEFSFYPKVATASVHGLTDKFAVLRAGENGPARGRFMLVDPPGREQRYYSLFNRVAGLSPDNYRRRFAVALSGSH